MGWWEEERDSQGKKSQENPQSNRVINAPKQHLREQCIHSDAGAFETMKAQDCFINKFPFFKTIAIPHGRLMSLFSDATVWCNSPGK